MWAPLAPTRSHAFQAGEGPAEPVRDPTREVELSGTLRPCTSPPESDRAPVESAPRAALSATRRRREDGAMKAIMYHYIRPETKDLPFLRYLHVDDFSRQLDF